jgi:hypothetical protein
MFEQQGFARTRQLGKNSWLVTKMVRARRTHRPRGVGVGLVC